MTCLLILFFLSSPLLNSGYLSNPYKFTFSLNDIPCPHWYLSCESHKAIRQKYFFSSTLYLPLVISLNASGLVSLRRLNRSLSLCLLYIIHSSVVLIINLLSEVPYFCVSLFAHSPTNSSSISPFWDGVVSSPHVISSFSFPKETIRVTVTVTKFPGFSLKSFARAILPTHTVSLWKLEREKKWIISFSPSLWQNCRIAPYKIFESSFQHSFACLGLPSLLLGNTSSHRSQAKNKIPAL